MKAYTTKYALTKGIEVVDGSVSPDYPEMLTVTAGGYRTHYHGNDWHTSFRAAYLRAEVMRQKKMASLEKSIKKLRELRFGPKEQQDDQAD